MACYIAERWSFPFHQNMSTHDGITMQFNIFWWKRKLTSPQSILSGAAAAKMNDRRPRGGEGELMGIIWCYEIGSTQYGTQFGLIFLHFWDNFLLKYLQHTLEIQCLALIVHISCPKVYALLSFAVVGVSQKSIYTNRIQMGKKAHRERRWLLRSAHCIWCLTYSVF